MKIKVALYKSKEIALDDYQDEMKGELNCPYCGVPLSYVTKHIRILKNNIEIEVSPYFRVSTGSHYNHCKYLLKNRMYEIFRNLNESGDQYDFLEKRDKDLFSFHLKVITDESFHKKNNYSLFQRNNKTIDKSYAKMQKAFLKTIKEIIMLKQSIEDDEEIDLRKMVQLSYCNKISNHIEFISWDKFYFGDDVESYRKLYSYIERNKPNHPLCIVGQIKKIVRKEKYTQINLKAHKKSDNELISIQLLTKNTSIFENLSEKQNIVVYAQEFRTYKNEEKTDEYGNFYCNIKAWVNVSQQIMTL